MKWTTQQLQQFIRERTDYAFSDVIDISDVCDRDSEIRYISPVTVSGRLIPEGDKMSFWLDMTGEMILPSAKTLADVHYPFHTETLEVFTYDEALTSEEDEIHVIEHDVIDLIPFIKEAVLVAKPIKVSGDDDDMLSSGEGWEVIDEKHEQEKIDPRLEKLQQLLDYEDSD